MRVTIIADASHCPDTGAAGYGYWAVSERGRQAGGGAMQTPIDSSIAAEMAAIVNGLYYACASQIAMPGDHVLLQSDCTPAIAALDSSRKELSTAERFAKSQFFAIKKKYGVTISFRHVKGHSKSTEARYVTNNLCDQRAKNGMRLARKRLKGDTT